MFSVVFIIVLDLITSILSENLTVYSVVPVSTEPFNVSSLNTCLCACLKCYDCRYFSYWWSLNSSQTCQIYNIKQEKPDIVSYSRIINDNQTGLYVVESSKNICQLLPEEILLFNYTNVTTEYLSLEGKNIVSLLTFDNDNLLAISNNNNTYYTIDQDSFQILGKSTSRLSCNILCARKISRSNILLCCASGSIEHYQVNINRTTGKSSINLLGTYDTSGRIPQDLVLCNESILFYVTNLGDIYQLSVVTNTSVLVVSLNGSTFLAPYRMFDIDESNRILYLVSTNGTLFRLPLTLFGPTILIVLSNDINTYQLIIPRSASILFDQCYRLWIISSSINSAYRTQMIALDTRTLTNKLINSASMINITEILPPGVMNNTVNFFFDSNYSIYVNNQQDIYRLNRQLLC